MKSIAGQAIGQRTEQQDSFHTDDSTRLYIVSDGMGGHEDGALASKTAVETLVKEHANGSELEVAFWAADAAVKSIEYYFKSPGATAVVLHIGNEVARVGNIGDSRCYRMRDGQLLQITKDHNLAPYAPNILTRSLGKVREEERSKPDFFDVSIEPGDRFLLCSDAMSSMDREELLDLLQKALSVPMEEGISMLLKQPTSDNNTVVIVEV